MTFKHINLTAERIRSLDPHDMLGKTLELPQQIRTGLVMGREFADSHGLEKIAELEWVGLGGSAVAGDLLQGFGFEPPQVPLRIRVQRFPRAPQGQRLLCSYSGNTIETVRAFEQTPPQQIWFAASSGGRLKDLAVKAGVPHLSLPAGYPPRAAVGFMLGIMLGIGERLYGTSLGDLDTLSHALECDAKTYALFSPAENPALELATHLVDRTIVIYTVDGLTMPGVAFRFRAQLAENAKAWSHASELPELAHNEVESFAVLQQLLPPPMIILLGSWPLTGSLPDPRPSLCSLIQSYGISCQTLDPAKIWGNGLTRLETGLQTMLLLDAASIWLAVLKATDPLEIPTITALKELYTKS